ncbi:MAG: cell division protein FtsA [Deltaproteobacteria bacterium]|nr:cell division protein FtsA [Deltaproteobacteria bacterium]
MLGKKDSLVVGLDIGTTKICAMVGQRRGEGVVEIVGIGNAPSKGLRKGVVVNIESTVQSIQKAVEEAEMMAGCQIRSVYAGISGAHIKAFNSHGIVAVKDGEVKESDVQRVVDAARAVAIPMDREIIHVFPQEFILDDQDGIKEPLGMSGVRLEAKVHIVTGAVASAQNIIKCASKTGLSVRDIVLQQYASSEAVLTPDEKELGVTLIDIGGGTTNIAIFFGGAIRHTAVLPIGGNHITSDVAVGLRTPVDPAEKIKQQYGCALSSMVSKEETIEVMSIGERKLRLVSRQALTEIIQPRVEEIFHLVHREIVRSGFEDLLAAGVVLTGGTASLHGIEEIAEKMLNGSARRGIPQSVQGLVDIVGSPIYATAVGLVLYGLRQESGGWISTKRGMVGKVRTRMREWFSEFF